MASKRKAPECPEIETLYYSTRFEEFKRRLIWKIGGFTTYFLNKFDASMTSPIFQLDDLFTDFSVSVHPKGVNEKESFLSLFLHVSQPAHVLCEVSLICASGEKMYKTTLTLVGAESGGIDEYVSLADLKDQKDQLLPDDQLTVCCILTMTGQIQTTREAESSGDQNTSGDADTKRLKLNLIEKLQRNTLHDDMKQLYDDEASKDIVLKAGRAVIPAHKMLLISRSPVFKSMFVHDMIECNTNEVVIPDTESDVLRELVRFMYTDEMPSGDVNFVLKLLIAADKYDVAILKLRCAEHLCDNVSIDNMFQVLMVADACNVGELTQLCLSKMKLEMGNLSDWISQLNECPQVLPIIQKHLKE